MATSRTPSREPGSSYSFTPSPSPRRTQYTFSTQRAEFTKPVPAALLPVYPKFAQDSDSDDESVNVSTMPMAMSQGQKQGPSAADIQDVDTMATVGQATLVRGFAEESGINPTSNITNLHTDDLDRSLEIDDMKVQPETYSNSVMAKLASLLGLQRRRPAKLTSNAISSPSLPALSYSQDPKYFPFPSPMRSDYWRPCSSLPGKDAEGHRIINIPGVIEGDRELPCDSAELPKPPGQQNEPLKQSKQGQGSSYTSATYPPPVRPNRHRRFRSLGISSAPAGLDASNQASLITFAQEVPAPDLRSRSMDDQRCGQTTSMDGSLWSYHVPPVSVPPNCLLVQVWAVGLDESDRRLVVGSGGCIVADAPSFKRSQEADHDQGRRQYKEGGEEEGAVTYSIFTGSKLLGWSLDLEPKNKKKIGWLPVSSPKSLSRSRRTKGKRIVRDVSLPKTSQPLEAGCIPGQSFVGRVFGVGSVVEKSLATKGDWVAGLVDIRKCGPLAQFIVIDRRQVHRVPKPYASCSLDNATATLVSDLRSGKPTEDVGGEPLLPPLTFDELALLPLCGIPAYRAVQAIDAFPAGHVNFNGGCILGGPTSGCSQSTYDQRRRVLVLRGHDGVGAMAVQMLVRQGWRVSAHVPFSRVPCDASQAEADGFMFAIEDRLKKWGADEVIYDDGVSYTNWGTEMDDRKAAVVRVIETLRGDGDAFDAVLDLVGGQEIQEASERLLKLNGCFHGVGQITTLLDANVLDDPIPTLADTIRPGPANLSTFTLPDLRSYADEHTEGFRDVWSGDTRRVKHTLMEGVFESEEDVCEILRTVLRLALEEGIRPHVEEAGGELFGRRRSVSLEKVSDVMMDGELLSDGGIVVVRVIR